MRQIVVDTETTGLDFSRGHRVVEVGCVEMLNRRPSGSTFHHYFHPHREIDEAAIEIHGLTVDMLQDKPDFADLAAELLDYIKGAELIIHNAPFDVGFLNNEFELAGLGTGVVDANCTVVDTQAMARDKHPGQRNNLDSLCKRYDVDNSQRTLHGGLIDAEILADVYLAMTGGQVTLLDDLAESAYAQNSTPEGDTEPPATPVIRASGEELEQHEKWLQLLEKKSAAGVIWRRLEDAN